MSLGRRNGEAEFRATNVTGVRTAKYLRGAVCREGSPQKCAKPFPLGCWPAPEPAGGGRLGGLAGRCSAETGGCVGGWRSDVLLGVRAAGPSRGEETCETGRAVVTPGRSQPTNNKSCERSKNKAEIYLVLFLQRALRYQGRVFQRESSVQQADVKACTEEEQGGRQTDAELRKGVHSSFPVLGVSVCHQLSRPPTPWEFLHARELTESTLPDPKFSSPLV